MDAFERKNKLSTYLYTLPWLFGLQPSRNLLFKMLLSPDF